MTTVPPATPHELRARGSLAGRPRGEGSPSSGSDVPLAGVRRIVAGRRTRLDLIANLARPPLGDRRFWLAQSLVVAVLAVHLFGDLLQDRGELGVPGFVWLLGLFLPVVYAGTAFGLVGALATSIEGTAISVPQELLWTHGSTALWAAWSTLATLNLCALLLGDRFEEARLQQARLLAEERSKIAEYFEGHPLSWQRLLEMVPDSIALVDPGGRIRYVNDRFVALSGYGRDELVGERVEILVPSALRARHAHDRLADGDGRRLGPRHMAVGRAPVLQRKDGSLVPVDVLLAPVNLDGSAWTLAAVRDERARRAADHAREEAERREQAAATSAARALAESEQRFRLTFESNMTGIILVDPSERILQANPAFCDMVGYEEHELLGRSTRFLTAPEDEEIGAKAHRRLLDGEVESVGYTKHYRRRDGQHILVEVQKARAVDPEGRTAYFVCAVRDVTRQHLLTERLSHEALHDPLTGLANRRLFEDRLTSTLMKGERGDGALAVMLLDLDNFKGVNDTLGHDVGDELLVTLARRLERSTRQGDTLARLGGDEFLYLAEHVGSSDDATRLGARLLSALTTPFLLSGHSLDVRASLGIALLGPGTTTSEGAKASVQELLRCADIALYEAKRQGRNRLTVFDDAMRERASTRFELAQELGHALARAELEMHYQPLVALDGGELRGFEALMRWNSPTRGPVAPELFIPLAERSDLILELGAFALRRAVTDACGWDRPASNRRLRLAVNLSPSQLYAPTLVHDLTRVLEGVGFDPRRLVLEVTESAVLRDADAAARVLDALRELGVHVAIDDFGSGYSSLSRLAQLRPSILKIDRSFVSPGGERSADPTLLRTLIALGHQLEMTVIAEGVETPEQRDLLAELGCDLGQGFLFARPLPRTAVHALIDGWPQRAREPT